MTQPKILTGVIFDLDGTLVDSAPEIYNALNAFLTSYGRRTITRAEADAHRIIGDGALKLVERALSLTGSIPSNLDKEFEDFIHFYQTTPADPAQIYPGVVALLEQLQQRGVERGLCTNKPESITRRLLQDLNLAQHFGAVVGGDTFPVRKPHPDHIRGVIERLGLGISGCVMVGDSANDMLAAHGLGIPCILVDYGYDSEARLLPAEAVISTMADLPAALARLGFGVETGREG